MFTTHRLDQELARNRKLNLWAHLSNVSNGIGNVSSLIHLHSANEEISRLKSRCLRIIEFILRSDKGLVTTEVISREAYGTRFVLEITLAWSITPGCHEALNLVSLETCVSFLPHDCKLLEILSLEWRLELMVHPKGLYHRTFWDIFIVTNVSTMRLYHRL